jgi:succinoglycan biosynthesis transport protein ExoP
MSNMQPFAQTVGQGANQPESRQFWSAPTLLEYWNGLKRHIWLATAIVAVTLVIGLILTLLMTPQYTATSRIEIAREQANVTNVEGLQREDSTPNQEFYLTQYSLLNARSLAERVERRLRLASNNDFFAAHGVTPEGEGFLSSNNAAPVSVDRMRGRQRQAVDLLLKNVAISPLRGSALIDVSYTSASADISRNIARTWVSEFAQQSMDRRFASTSDARVYLETRLQGLRERLEQSERDLVNYAARQGIVRLSETQSNEGRTKTTQTLASSNLEQLNRVLVQATAERTEAESQLRAARAPGSTQLALQNSSLNTLRQKRAEANAQYQDLLVHFEPEYPEAKAAQQQVAALDRAIGAEERRVREAYQASFDAATQREQALRGRVNELLGQFDSESRSSIQYNIYQREVDTNRQLYDSLLQRYKEIGVAGVGTNNISVVDAAPMPEKPSSPRLLVNLVLALLAGLVLAAIAVIVLENLDESLREPNQLTTKLNVPLLGAIPVVDDEALENMDDPKSILSEAYMTVRTNLSFSTDHGVPKTMALTSTSPSEGKSTSAYSLARVLGRTSGSVVLVDVDMRRPILASRLGLDNSRGVSNFLAGDDNWEALLQETGKLNVHFVAAGPTPPSASELLSGERLALFVEHLARRFDHVILDSPPMLDLSDAPLIANVVEGVVYVIEADRTAVRASLAAIERLRDSRAHILGALLTKYRAKQSGYGYGYGYGSDRAENEDAGSRK